MRIKIEKFQFLVPLSLSAHFYDFVTGAMRDTIWSGGSGNCPDAMQWSLLLERRRCAWCSHVIGFLYIRAQSTTRKVARLGSDWCSLERGSFDSVPIDRHTFHVLGRCVRIFNVRDEILNRSDTRDPDCYPFSISSRQMKIKE